MLFTRGGGNAPNTRLPTKSALRAGKLSPMMEGLKKYNLPNKLTIARVMLVPLFMLSFIVGMVRYLSTLLIILYILQLL